MAAAVENFCRLAIRQWRERSTEMKSLAQGVVIFMVVFVGSILAGNLLWMLLGYEIGVAFQWALFLFFIYRALRPDDRSGAGLKLK
jgi:uncharacterized membrane protein